MSAAKIKKGDQRCRPFGQGQGPHRHCPPGHAQGFGKVLVQGVNVATRHRKPTQENPQGGIDRREAPMAIQRRSASPIPRRQADARPF